MLSNYYDLRLPNSACISAGIKAWQAYSFNGKEFFYSTRLSDRHLKHLWLIDQWSVYTSTSPWWKRLALEKRQWSTVEQLPCIASPKHLGGWGKHAGTYVRHSTNQDCRKTVSREGGKLRFLILYSRNFMGEYYCKTKKCGPNSKFCGKTIFCKMQISHTPCTMAAFRQHAHCFPWGDGHRMLGSCSTACTPLPFFQCEPFQSGWSASMHAPH